MSKYEGIWHGLNMDVSVGALYSKIGSSMKVQSYLELDPCPDPLHETR